MKVSYKGPLLKNLVVHIVLHAGLFMEILKYLKSFIGQRFTSTTENCIGPENNNVNFLQSANGNVKQSGMVLAPN